MVQTNNGARHRHRGRNRVAMSGISGVRRDNIVQTTGFVAHKTRGMKVHAFCVSWLAKRLLTEHPDSHANHYGASHSPKPWSRSSVAVGCICRDESCTRLVPTQAGFNVQGLRLQFRSTTHVYYVDQGTTGPRSHARLRPQLPTPTA